MEDFHPKLFGRYLLVEKLAMGGMAEVYRAKTFGIDGFEKQLALKRVLPHYSRDQQFIEMLVNEAKLSVLINHSNIIQVYDLGRVEDDYFISMEFINGVNLHDILNRLKTGHRTLPEAISVHIISEVCRGLEYAHFKTDKEGRPLDIIHRDISPPNILVSFEGEVKVGDFGIAKATMNSTQTQSGIIKGKVVYMSPEQAGAEVLDYRTDIFSTGMVLYEILTGNKFFSGDTQLEVLKKIQDTWISEDDIPDSINSELRRILAKALCHSREGRYTSAGSMQVDLSRYLNSHHPEFTSRTLTKLMQSLFNNEIKKRKDLEAREGPMDSNTRHSLISSTSQKSLVGMGDQPTGVISTHTHRLGEEETIVSSGIFQRMTRNKPAQYVFYSLFGMMLILSGLWAYQRLGPFKGSPSKNMAMVKIESEPKGAQILINGGVTNLSTPATIDTLEVGKSYKITLRKPDFEDWSNTITLLNQNPIIVNPTLQKFSEGMILVTSNPPGAQVFLDNKDTGKITPAVIDKLPIDKSYNLKLQLANYHPSEESFLLNSTEPLKLNKELKKVRPAVVLKRKESRVPASSTTATQTAMESEPKEEPKGGAANTMGRGFKKAGSSIKGFFSGKKSKEE